MDIQVGIPKESKKESIIETLGMPGDSKKGLAHSILDSRAASADDSTNGTSRDLEILTTVGSCE